MGKEGKQENDPVPTIPVFLLSTFLSPFRAFAAVSNRVLVAG
jgi:hypothetical protein